MQSSILLHAILRRVIRRGFPELARKRFMLAIGRYDEWMYYKPAGPGGFEIGVDESLLSASPRVIEGGFAHELAHILRDSRMRPWRLDRAFSLYRNSPAYRIRDERETDGEAIARGYGPQLLALMSYGRARGYSWSREEGMTVAEVHSALARTRKTVPFRGRPGGGSC